MIPTPPQDPTSPGYHGDTLIGGGQMSVLRWLAAGASGSYGTVREPCNYPQKFPETAVLLPYYFAGNSLVEAYWKSVQWPGEGIFVGDPLTRPYGTRATLEARKLVITTSSLDPGKRYAVYAASSLAGPFSEVQGAVEIGDWPVVKTITLPATDPVYMLIPVEGKLRIRPVTVQAQAESAPSISGKRIAFVGSQNPLREVYVHDLDAGDLRLTYGAKVSSTRPPRIDGDWVAWTADGPRIGIANLVTRQRRELELDKHGATKICDYNIDLDHGRVVWADDRNGHCDVFFYDIAGDHLDRLTTDPADQSSPVISGSRIVWEDERHARRTGRMNPHFRQTTRYRDLVRRGAGCGDGAGSAI